MSSARTSLDRIGSGMELKLRSSFGKTKTDLLRSSAFVLATVLMSSGLTGCDKKSADATAAADALALPLTTGPATAIVPAPAAAALPSAPPVKIVRVANQPDEYAYADQAYAMSSAVGEAPPDYEFDYQGVHPWAWRSSDRSVRLTEPVDGGDRYYYYQPGQSEPYLVRDPQYSYGYSNGQLVVVYDSEGRPVPPGDIDQRVDSAGRYLARAIALYEASLQSQRHSVNAANWAERRAELDAARSQWQAQQRQQDAWRAYHAEHEAEEKSYWQPEYERRYQSARSFDDWSARGFNGPPPPPAHFAGSDAGDYHRDPGQGDHTIQTQNGGRTSIGVLGGILSSTGGQRGDSREGGQPAATPGQDHQGAVRQSQQQQTSVDQARARQTEADVARRAQEEAQQQAVARARQQQSQVDATHQAQAQAQVRAQEDAIARARQQQTQADANRQSQAKAAADAALAQQQRAKADGARAQQQAQADAAHKAQADAARQSQAKAAADAAAQAQQQRVQADAARTQQQNQADAAHKVQADAARQSQARAAADAATQAQQQRAQASAARAQQQAQVDAAHKAQADAARQSQARAAADAATQAQQQRVQADAARVQQKAQADAVRQAQAGRAAQAGRLAAAVTVPKALPAETPQTLAQDEARRVAAKRKAEDSHPRDDAPGKPPAQQ